MIRKLEQGHLNIGGTSYAIYMFDPQNNKETMFVYIKNGAVAFFDFTTNVKHPDIVIYGRRSVMYKELMDKICGTLSYKLLDEREFWAVFDEYCTALDVNEDWR